MLPEKTLRHLITSTFAEYAEAFADLADDVREGAVLRVLALYRAGYSTIDHIVRREIVSLGL